jgi:hypothetical protein
MPRQPRSRGTTAELPSRAQYYPNYYTDHALPGKRSRNCGVRKVGENIIFRLHSTEVITWRPDGSVRVNVYHSQSTCVFINNFIPNHLSISMHNNGYVLRNLETLDAIPLRDDFTIFADGTIGETDPAAFGVQRINKPVAKRLREEVGYPAFTKWRKIMEPLLTGQHDWREQWNTDSELSRRWATSGPARPRDVAKVHHRWARQPEHPRPPLRPPLVRGLSGRLRRQPQVASEWTLRQPQPLPHYAARITVKELGYAC